MQEKELQPGKGAVSTTGANCPSQGQHFGIAAAFPPRISAFCSSDVASHTASWAMRCQLHQPAHSTPGSQTLLLTQGTSPLLGPKTLTKLRYFLCSLPCFLSPCFSLLLRTMEQKMTLHKGSQLFSTAAGLETRPSHVAISPGQN